jgi:hypothetical protein
MDSSAPNGSIPTTADLKQRMQSLIELRAQMLELHARLEYLRLMLRLNRPRC